MSPQARQLVKDGFLVELSDCSRKLRHVFLFTDLLLCAKMKKTSVGYVPPPTPHARPHVAGREPEPGGLERSRCTVYGV